MEYEKYSEVDFATDDFFCEWVLTPTLETDDFWINWLVAHAADSRKIQKARSLVLLARQDPTPEPSDGKIDELWQEIVARTQGTPKTLRIQWQKATGLVAASLALLLIAYTGYRYIFERSVTYETTNGEVRRLQLSDGTMVTLNANSSLKVATSGLGEVPREAWLQGEAFFKVKKIQQEGQAVKFRVHTDDVVVEVKGTEFNVNTRQNKTRVVLSEGNVQLRLVNSSREVLQMKPGDLVDYSKPSNRLATKKLSDLNAWCSWKDNRWTFDRTPLAEVAVLITETYGIPVELENIPAQDYKVTGVIPSDNLDDILSSLESILDIKIDQNTKRIRIQSVPN